MVFCTWAVLTSGWKCNIAMIQLYATYACGNKINSNDERTHFFKKIYLSHFVWNGWERVVWERWVGDWTGCQVPLSLAALLSHSADCSTGGPEGPALCWDLVLSALNCNSNFNFNCNWLQLTQLSMAPGYIIVWHPPASRGHHNCTKFNPSSVKVISWYLWPDTPVIYTGASLIWQLGQGSICNKKMFSSHNVAVLYSFRCVCSLQYLGRTNQCLDSRIKQHVSTKIWQGNYFADWINST